MSATYAFEAKSIQSYILDSSALKEMVGASELIEGLCGESISATEASRSPDLLNNVLDVLNLAESRDIEIARRAGGAFIAVCQDGTNASKLRDLWSFVVQSWAPGLEFTQALIKNADPLHALAELPEVLQHNRNRAPASLPTAGPLVARNPRTGRPACAREKRGDRPIERLDAATVRNRQTRFRDGRRLLDKLLPDPDYQIVWPQNLTLDPEAPDEPALLRGDEENRYIGVVHADGNGLGGVLHELRNDLKNREDAIKVWRAFSQALEEATIEAARDAARQHLIREAQSHRIMPARPLVLGGDDLTILVRGDLALPFTETFLERFEQQTKLNFQQLQDKYRLNSLPSYVSACAGIAFIKVNQPFYLAYSLAESLCREAKRASKASGNTEVPSSLAFHRVTTSIIESFPIVRERELTTSDGILLSMQPYAVGRRISQLPALEDLERLALALSHEAVSRGPQRELLSLLHESSEKAEKGYERWRRNMEETGKSELLKDIESSLEPLLGEPPDRLPINRQGHTPLADAWTWNVIGRPVND